MLITLLKNRLAQLSLAVILAAGIAYVTGYKDGTHSERLSAATATNQKIQTQTVKNNAVLAQKESQIIELTNRVTVLIEKQNRMKKLLILPIVLAIVSCASVPVVQCQEPPAQLLKPMPPVMTMQQFLTQPESFNTIYYRNRLMISAGLTTMRWLPLGSDCP